MVYTPFMADLDHLHRHRGMVRRVELRHWETWDAIDMGHTEADEQVLQVTRGAMLPFRDASARLAQAMDIELDSIDFAIAYFAIEYVRVSDDLDLGYMPASALRATWEGRIGSVVVVRSSVAWYLTGKLQENWTFDDDDHYHVSIVGEPNVEMRMNFVAPEWSGGDWSVLTALPMVNAIPQVVARPSGIRGLEDMGLVVAPVGAWRNSRPGA